MTARFLSLVFTITSATFLGFSGEGNQDFSGSSLPDSWSVAKGEWIVSEGSLHGKEVAEDKHAAVLTIPDSHADSEICFRVKMSGAKAFHLSYNHPKGHLFRVRYDGKQVALVLDRDKKDPESKAITLASEPLTLDDGAEVNVSCKIAGDSVSVTFGDVLLSGSSAKLTAAKTGYRFIVQGESVAIDDVVYTSSK